MQFLRLRNRAMAGLVESGLWKLISTNRAFFSGLYGEPSGEPVPVVHFFSLLKMKGDYLQKKTGPIAKQNGRSLTRSLRKELGLQPHRCLAPYSMTQLP